MSLHICFSILIRLILGNILLTQKICTIKFGWALANLAKNVSIIQISTNYILENLFFLTQMTAQTVTNILKFLPIL